MEKSFESSSVYEDYGLELANTIGWDFQNGFSKGDVIFVVGARNVEVGDVIIFHEDVQYPLIHRVVSVEDDVYSTKGDNYKTNSQQRPAEKSIDESRLIGKALFKVPAIGWVKLIFFEAGKSTDRRGLCS